LYLYSYHINHIESGEINPKELQLWTDFCIGSIRIIPYFHHSARSRLSPNVASDVPQPSLNGQEHFRMPSALRKHLPSLLHREEKRYACLSLQTPHAFHDDEKVQRAIISLKILSSPTRRKNSEKDPSIHFCLNASHLITRKKNMCKIFYVGVQTLEWVLSRKDFKNITVIMRSVEPRILHAMPRKEKASWPVRRKWRLMLSAWSPLSSIGVSRDEGRSQQQKTTLSIRMPSMVESTM